CTCTGSATRCGLVNGERREMTIMAGKSGNVIVQSKGVNMSTKVALYHHDNSMYGVFRDNQTRPINFMPDEVKDRVREKIKIHLENSTIELDEDGLYQYQGKKRAKLFGLFPVRENVVTQIDSETGDIIRTRNSWWGFLARDVIEETTSAE
ncbi:hypothetical protein GOV13_02355, partial [Candidatus Pacearchaeota archaeon]|nr:hypothetical protein [Candidatus Pacearchaeota archaeon]